MKIVINTTSDFCEENGLWVRANREAGRQTRRLLQGERKRWVGPEWQRWRKEATSFADRQNVGRKKMVLTELPGAQWLRGICLDGRPRDLGMWERDLGFGISPETCGLQEMSGV